MFTVALIGPDGAGKTTIARRLEQRFPLPLKYLYMGVSRDSSNHMLPTTRLIHLIKRACGAKPDAAGPADPDLVWTRPEGILKRAGASIRSGLGLINQVSEEWFRQALAWHYRRGGNIVVFDRHFFSDYFASDLVSNGSEPRLTRRIHLLMLNRVYPKPDLVIYLDAPAEVLFARKGEGTLKSLEHRRRGYLRMRPLTKNFVVVDASRAEEEVARDVTDHISRFYERRVGARPNPCDFV